MVLTIRIVWLDESVGVSKGEGEQGDEYDAAVDHEEDDCAVLVLLLRGLLVVEQLIEPGLVHSD